MNLETDKLSKLFNSIKTLVLEGMFHDANGRFAPAVLSRANVPIDFIKPVEPPPEFKRKQTIYVPRPPSQLPPAGHLTLKASLGKVIGRGRCSVVYEVRDPEVSDTTAQLPQIVLKVAWASRCGDINREGWFYDEMECLQGVALARCYGLFEADIPGGCTVSLPDGSNFQNDAPTSHNMIIDEDRVHPKFLELRDKRNRLSILVLERLGGRLPLGEVLTQELRYVSYPPSSHKKFLLTLWSLVREDVETLFEEIGQLGIRNCLDLHWANILKAPESPPGLPSLPSPYLHRTHGWRLIDFDLAEKTKQIPDHLWLQHNSYLEGILDDLPRESVAC